MRGCRGIDRELRRSSSPLSGQRWKLSRRGGPFRTANEQNIARKVILSMAMESIRVSELPYWGTGRRDLQRLRWNAKSSYVEAIVAAISDVGKVPRRYTWNDGYYHPPVNC